MTKQEREALLQLIEKAALLLPGAEYILIERNTLKLSGVRVSSYGSPEYIEEQQHLSTWLLQAAEVIDPCRGLKDLYL